jgi:hypothetical protein
MESIRRISGDSGTSLASKLGFKEGFKVKLVNQPDYYFELFTDLPKHLEFIELEKVKKDLICYFTTDAVELQKDIKKLKKEIFEDGAIWVSWPKKTSKSPTDVSENLIRDLALKNGLVDVKVCTVDQTWSGLKLVIPVMNRK